MCMRFIGKVLSGTVAWTHNDSYAEALSPIAATVSAQASFCRGAARPVSGKARCLAYKHARGWREGEGRRSRLKL